jgi:hypothetical protein
MEHMAGELGLTPWAAFPFALGCALAPVGMYERELEDLELDIDSLEGQCDNLICELYAHSESERVEPCTCEEPHCSPCIVGNDPYVPITDKIIDDWCEPKVIGRAPF